jgi:hypothetical protein
VSKTQNPRNEQVPHTWQVANGVGGNCAENPKTEIVFAG